SDLALLHEHVGGLQIAVDAAHLVEGADASGQLNEPVAQPRAREAGPADRRRWLLLEERRPTHPLHGEEPEVAVAEQLVQDDEVLVGDVCDPPELLLEPSEGEPRGPVQDLERELLPPVAVEHRVHDSARTLAQELERDEPLGQVGDEFHACRCHRPQASSDGPDRPATPGWLRAPSEDDPPRSEPTRGRPAAQVKVSSLWTTGRSDGPSNRRVTRPFPAAAAAQASSQALQRIRCREYSTRSESSAGSCSAP